MNLMARIKGLRHHDDEKLAEETLEAKAPGFPHEAGVNSGLQTGLVREDETFELEHADEHEKPH